MRSQRSIRRLIACVMSLFSVAALLCPLSLQVASVGAEDASPGLSSLTSLADPAPEHDKIRGACLLNLENDLILYQKNTEELLYPSSAVKILSGLLFCRALEGRLEETVSLSSAMLEGSSGRLLGLREGETLTIEELLYAALCGSYNDATCALAYITSGSQAAFVDSMNREAVHLGAASSRFTNATGLHDAAMVTTVADVVCIAREACRNSLYMTVSSAPSYTIAARGNGEPRSFSNRNALVCNTNRDYYNGYCRGLNAGCTDEGGWCVVSLYQRNGASNLCVLLGGEAGVYDAIVPAYTYASQLFSWANTQFRYRAVLTEGQVVGTQKVEQTGVSKSKTDLQSGQDLSLYLPVSVNPDDLVLDYLLEGGSLEAPLRVGNVVGRVRVLVPPALLGESSSQTATAIVLGSAPLVVQEDFDMHPFLETMRNLRSYLTGRAALITLICFLTLLLCYLHWIASPTQRRRLHLHRRRRRR